MSNLKKFLFLRKLKQKSGIAIVLVTILIPQFVLGGFPNPFKSKFTSLNICSEKLEEITPKEREEQEAKELELNNSLYKGPIISLKRYKARDFNYERVKRLLLQFETDPEYFKSWYADFRGRADQGRYIDEELVAVDIYQSEKARALWELLLPKQNIVVRKRHFESPLVRLFSDSFYDRAYASRKVKWGLFPTQTFKIVVPKRIPYEIGAITTLFGEPSLALDRAAISITNAMLKVEESTEGARNNIALRRAVLSLVATLRAGWDVFTKALPKTFLDSNFKDKTYSTIWNELFARVFNPKIKTNRFAQDVFREEFLTKIGQYLEKPETLITDPPQLDPFEQAILEKEGFQTLLFEVLQSRGMMAAVSLLKSIMAYAVPLAIIAYGKSKLAGGGLDINGRNRSQEACKATDADKDRLVSNDDWNPFVNTFMNPVVDTKTQKEISNPCDPDRSLKKFVDDAKEKWPSDSLGIPSRGYIVNVVGNPKVVKHWQRHIQNIILTDGGACLEHYAQVTRCSGEEDPSDPTD